MKISISTTRFLCAVCLGLFAAGKGFGGSLLARPDIYTGVYANGAFESLTFVNSVVGWDTFFQAGYLGSGRVIANVESGLVWGGHEAFLRPAGSDPAVALTLAGDGVVAETDFHATMVGHVLAGSGYVANSNPAQFTYVGLGMAPLAQIWSGAIATSYSPTETGSFSTTYESVIPVYRSFFQGINGVTPDAINSSWGGSDPAAASAEMVALDGLARQNPTVALVTSAGNGGAAAVAAPGAAFNGITVGALGGAAFLTPSGFSSSGAVDFYNPVTDELITGVRAGVDLAAPGESLVLAAYLGQSGSLGASSDPQIQAILQANPPTDQYFLNQDGTSFSSPIVAGAITLLKDAAANDLIYNLNGVAAATDTRVIKSVLMAGATRTEGWDNGQAANGSGVIETTQSLDFASGAGAVNLDQAAGIYLLSATRDLNGLTGGAISGSGWDFGSLSPSQSNQYVFSNPFDSPVELTVSLNWFAGREFNNLTGIGEDLSFSDLNLEVWQVLDGQFLTMLADSRSVYNNTEFLRLNLPGGQYGIRITFNGLVYGNVTDESYGLAWQSQAVPEPATFVLVLLALGGAVLARSRLRCVR